MAQFKKIMVRLAARTNSLLTWEGDVAHMIERDSNGLPSSKVWSKTFSFDGENVTVKVHGKVLPPVPLAKLAAMA